MERLYSVAAGLLNHVDHPGPVRLGGMVAYDLVCIDDFLQLDLFSNPALFADRVGRSRQAAGPYDWRYDLVG